MLRNVVVGKQPAANKRVKLNLKICFGEKENAFKFRPNRCQLLILSADLNDI